MNVRRNIIIVSILLLLVFIAALPVFSQFSRLQSPSFAGSREPGVETEIQYDKGLILFKFSMAADYHITDLKHGFFRIEVDENDHLEIGRTVFPQGVPYADEIVFKGDFTVKVYVKSLKPVEEPVDLTFKVSYQVCQERPEELCYPPESKEVAVKIDKTFQKYELSSEMKGESEGRSKREDESYSQWVERIIKQELEKKSLLLFALVFFAGFLTSFTPCVYPVIPIVMGYVGTRSGKSKFKGFYLSIFFVLGLAVVYSILGVIAASTGTMVGITFQNPVVVIVISAIFIVMGLSLAGLFEIPVPSSLSAKIQSGQKGGIVGALLVGGVAGIIAAPCVGPVLIALLSWISQTGNIVLGFWLTFIFSLGLGVIFLIVGTFSGVVSALPKGGKWMDYVKYFFALLLMAGGLYFLDTIIADWLGLLLWGIFLTTAALFMGLFKPLADAKIVGKLFKVLLLLIFLVGAFLFVKGLDLKYFPARYGLAVEEVRLPWIGDLDEGKRVAGAENKMLMIDTYADWCVACEELEKRTFSALEVSERLKELILVKLDFTQRNETNEALRKSLGIIGMPTIIFLAPDGSEIKRFSGFKNKKDFLAFLDSLN